MACVLRQPHRGCFLLGCRSRVRSRWLTSLGVGPGSRWVERCCPATRQARRSETLNNVDEPVHGPPALFRVQQFPRDNSLSMSMSKA